MRYPRRPNFSCLLTRTPWINRPHRSAHNCPGVMASSERADVEPSSDRHARDTVLRVLSWNIDGLDGRDTRSRTLRVCELIHARRPHVVYLQEVVPLSHSILGSQLGDHYSFHVKPSPAFQYYPAILVTKRCDGIKLHGDLGILDFPNSTMGRHLLQLTILAWGVPVALFTSHLESLKDSRPARKKQLKVCFELMEERRRTMKDAVSILGGDLNIRDEEVRSVGLPESVADVWEFCGEENVHRFTWDVSTNDNLKWPYPNKPRCRFDRFYFSPRSGSFVKPVKFELVGKERIPSCGCFASDHWGMWAEFSVKEIITID